MKVFYKYFAFPLITAVIAGTLYLADCLLAGLFVKDASFLWLAFVVWTAFYAASFQDRIRGLIGVVIGFFVAIIMMLITGSFTFNILTISVSCFLGIFVMNFFVMLLEHAKKAWINSTAGIFVAISLVFSGYGIGLSPLTDFSTGLNMFAILIVYTILGLTCGFFSMFFTKKIKAKNESLNKEKAVEVEQQETK